MTKGMLSVHAIQHSNPSLCGRWVLEIQLVGPRNGIAIVFVLINLNLNLGSHMRLAATALAGMAPGCLWSHGVKTLF